MADHRGAINGAAWGKFVRDGREHFDRVTRSFNVFARNAQELIEHVASAETDLHSSLRLIMDPRSCDEETIRFRQDFWAALDQRLHNMVSSAVTVVDHTRGLVRHYHRDNAFVAEWESRSREVATSPRAVFLRRLRNYLLHAGNAPILQTLDLNVSPSGSWNNFTIKLSADGLLNWPDWTAPARAYIESFDGGPALRLTTEGYRDDMIALYQWLTDQYPLLHPPGVPPPHLLGPDALPDGDERRSLGRGQPKRATSGE